MKFFGLLLLLIVGAALADNCNYCDYSAPNKNIQVSVGLANFTGGNAIFAIFVKNANTGSGLVNMISDVEVSASIGDNDVDVSPDQMGGIVAGAYHSALFSVNANKVNKGKCISIAVSFRKNGPRVKTWIGNFPLANGTSLPYLTRESNEIAVRTGDNISVPFGEWDSIDGQSITNSYPIQSGDYALITVTYSASHPDVVVSYMPTGHSYATFAANTGKTGSLGLLANLGTYNMTLNISYKFSGGTTVYNYVTYRTLTVSSSKRSSSIADGTNGSTQVATIRADYAIGIASAGVVVAAVAIVAAVVIVRRKTESETLL